MHVDASRVLGLTGLRVTGVVVGDDDALDLEIERVGAAVGCPHCGGTKLVIKERPVVGRGDLPLAGRVARLWWRKRRWACRDCGRTHTEQHPALPGRQRVSARFRPRLAGRAAGGARGAARILPRYSERPARAGLSHFPGAGVPHAYERVRAPCRNWRGDAEAHERSCRTTAPPWPRSEHLGEVCGGARYRASSPAWKNPRTSATASSSGMPAGWNVAPHSTTQAPSPSSRTASVATRSSSGRGPSSIRKV